MKQHWHNLTQCLSSSTSDKYSLFYNNNIIFSIAITNKKTIYNKELSNNQRGFISILVKIFLEIIFYLDICLMQKTSQFYIPFHHGVCVFIECIIRLLNIFTLNRFSHSTMQNTRHFSCFKGNIHCNQRVEWSEIHRDNSFFVNNVMVGWTLK